MLGLLPSVAGTFILLAVGNKKSARTSVTMEFD